MCKLNGEELFGQNITERNGASPALYSRRPSIP